MMTDDGGCPLGTFRIRNFSYIFTPLTFTHYRFCVSEGNSVIVFESGK